MTAAILAIGTMVPFTFGFVGVLNADWGKKGGL